MICDHCSNDRLKINDDGMLVCLNCGQVVDDQYESLHNVNPIYRDKMEYSANQYSRLRYLQILLGKWKICQSVCQKIEETFMN